MKRIILASGGTGGHIFPAVALAEELESKYQCTLMFAAGKLSQNPYFVNGRFAFKDISCGQVFFIKGIIDNIKGIFESIKILKEFKPDAVLGFGSYYTFPILTAAIILRIPLLLHEANSIPGRANRLFSSFAKHTWVCFPSAKKQLKGSVKECEMPLRPHFKKGQATRQEAFNYFGLSNKRPVILIFGGSQGAKGINSLFNDQTLLELKKHIPQVQVIHFTGRNQDEARLSELYFRNQIPFCVKCFEPRIDLAWSIADIAVTRAGASSIAEQCEYEVPGILIPYPYAMDDHQQHNADFLVDAGLALKVLEGNSGLFMGKLIHLFETREAARQKFLDFKRKNVRKTLSEDVIDWISHYQEVGG